MRKKNSKSKLVERCNIKLNEKLCIYVELPEEFLYQDETKRLLTRYRGRILFCENDFLGKDILEYSFDFKPYFKRALLSSLKNQIISSGNNNFSLSVCDKNFELNNEITELVGVIRKLNLITEETVVTQEFVDYCYYRFGAVVTVSDSLAKNNSDMFLDFESIDGTGKGFLNIQGKDMLLYPDASYFESNNDVNLLVSLGVPPKIACAGLELKEKIPVAWRNYNCS